MLAGLFSDLIHEGVDFGKEEASSRMRSHFGADHIAAQNQTTRDFGEVLDRLAESDYSNYDIDLAIRQIKSIAQGFEDEYAHLGSRAARGAQDVWTFANQLITDRERERRAGGPIGGAGGTTRRPSLLGGFSTTELAIGAGVLFLLFSRGRKSS